MKELTMVYIALTCITLIGCTSTRRYSLYDGQDRASMAQARLVRLELVDGGIMYGTNLQFGIDSLSFAVASEESWPPAKDFRGYNTTIALSDVARASEHIGDAKKSGAGMAALVTVLIGVALVAAISNTDSWEVDWDWSPN